MAVTLTAESAVKVVTLQRGKRAARQSGTQGFTYRLPGGGQCRSGLLEALAKGLIELLAQVDNAEIAADEVLAQPHFANRRQALKDRPVFRDDRRYVSSVDGPPRYPPADSLPASSSTCARKDGPALVLIDGRRDDDDAKEEVAPDVRQVQTDDVGQEKLDLASTGPTDPSARVPTLPRRKPVPSSSVTW